MQDFSIQKNIPNIYGSVQPAKAAMPLAPSAAENAGILKEDGRAQELQDMKRIGALRCATCESRQYVDKSDDVGVSFKSPQNVSPEASLGKVRSHENEHVQREKSSADREGRKVISQSVTVSMSSCPECGKSYAAGGQTRTVTKKENKNDSFMGEMRNFMAGHFGNYVDEKI